VSIGWFWDPPNRVIGMAGLFHDVVLHVGEHYSLARFIEVYAPAVENATAAYVYRAAVLSRIIDPEKVTPAQVETSAAYRPMLECLTAV
jgi:hypothetical protein